MVKIRCPSPRSDAVRSMSRLRARTRARACVCYRDGMATSMDRASAAGARESRLTRCGTACSLRAPRFPPPPPERRLRSRCDLRASCVAARQRKAFCSSGVRCGREGGGGHATAAKWSGGVIHENSGAVGGESVSGASATATATARKNEKKKKKTKPSREKTTKRDARKSRASFQGPCRFLTPLPSRKRPLRMPGRAVAPTAAWRHLPVFLIARRELTPSLSPPMRAVVLAITRAGMSRRRVQPTQQGQ